MSKEPTDKDYIDHLETSIKGYKEHIARLEVTIEQWKRISKLHLDTIIELELKLSKEG